MLLRGGLRLVHLHTAVMVCIEHSLVGLERTTSRGGDGGQALANKSGSGGGGSRLVFLYFCCTSGLRSGGVDRLRGHVHHICNDRWDSSRASATSLTSACGHSCIRMAMVH